MAKKITDDFIDSVNEKLWTQGVDNFGTKFAVPKDEIQRIGEIVRALYVLQKWQNSGSNGNPMTELRQHSVVEGIGEQVVSEYLSEKFVVAHAAEQNEKPEKRKDKWDSFIVWANENENKTFTTEELMTQCGFSYPTTLEYIKISPVFEKLKKGQYRVIPLADRVRKK